MLAAVLLIHCFSCAIAAHIKIESANSHVRDDFVRLEAALDKTLSHEVVFAVQQRNLDELERIVLDRSSPKSVLYQNWLSYSEVNELVSNPDGAEAVAHWLRSNGIEPSWTSKQHHYIKATASLEVWEALFSTEYFAFEDQSSENRVYFRSLDYSLPEELSRHVSAVFNTVQVPPSLRRRAKVKHTSKNSTSPQPFKTNLRPIGVTEKKPQTYAVDIDFLNDLYAIPSNIGEASISQAVFETANEYFSPADLTLFQQYYGITEQAADARAGYSTNQCSTTGAGKDCYEGNLDIQYLMAVSQVTASIYWYVSSSGTQDPFVVWMTEIAEDANPSKSNSISWGENEVFVTKSVMDSFNTEALKLAALGVTVMVSSGDDGVAGDYCSECRPNKKATPMNCPCIADSSSSSSKWKGPSWSGKGYFPSFPATSPYVTAVGATMGPEELGPEVACQSQLGGVITSGGGFSGYYPTPSWQTAAVASYFAHFDDTNSPSPGFNANGRGFPDISLIGVYYQTVIAAQMASLFGTSASTPVFAGFVSLVNAERLRQGLPSVGFINPTLYAAGAASFTDVTEGHIKCCSDSSDPPDPVCCTSGFTASEGWDPVSGWGSVTVPSLMAMLGGGTFPTQVPTTKAPTRAPSLKPTLKPTVAATAKPSTNPSARPSAAPTTRSPTEAAPVVLPTETPSVGPTVAPSSLRPSTARTLQPSLRKRLPNGGYASGHL